VGVGLTATQLNPLRAFRRREIWSRNCARATRWSKFWCRPFLAIPSADEKKIVLTRLPGHGMCESEILFPGHSFPDSGSVHSGPASRPGDHPSRVAADATWWALVAGGLLSSVKWKPRSIYVNISCTSWRDS
jgi:hypothetical protein